MLEVSQIWKSRHRSFSSPLQIQSISLLCSKHFIRQGKYRNNLEIRVIPSFIASKSSVGETILKTVLPHFSKDPVA